MVTETSCDSATLDVRGMWCTSCANAVERVLKRQPGVLDATVSFAAESAQLQWDPAVTTLAAVLAAVEKLGYACSAEGAGHDRRAHFARIRQDLIVRLVVAVCFSMWVMVAQWTLYLAPDGRLSLAERLDFASFAGAAVLPVVCWCALPFYRAGWRTLRAGAPGMDLLVSLGALGSSALSVWRLAHGSPIVYFDSAASIVTFLLAGRLIEMSVRARAADAVRTLLELPPDQVSVVEADGRESLWLAKRVERGNIIRVRPGERIALDGTVTSGSSLVDRSLLTGEGTLQVVDVGAWVEAGTLNGAGELLVSVQRCFGKRTVDHIAREVRRLLARKTASQTLAERFSGYLVPLVLLLALLSFAGAWCLGAPWVSAFEHAVAVLVITCPCALGMAVPLAISAGVGQAARQGILFRDVEAIEKASRISHVFLDKTGTLTEGSLKQMEVDVASGETRSQLIETAALAGRGSEHPLARAIRAHIPADRLAVIDLIPGTSRAVPGSGIEWLGADGMRVLVGNARWLEDHGIQMTGVQTVHTQVCVAREGRWLGTLSFSDTIRPDAPDCVARLRLAGATVGMLSGDHGLAAQRVARQVGIPDDLVYAGQSPHDKARRIMTEQAAGACVVFVGDGLNDAPALAAADIGVAVGNATASSMASAAIVLSADGIAGLERALAIARRTARVMKQNLYVSAAYNLLAIPFAVSGWVSPTLAAILMVASSLSVTLNTARLLGVRIRAEGRSIGPGDVAFSGAHFGGLSVGGQAR